MPKMKNATTRDRKRVTERHPDPFTFEFEGFYRRNFQPVVALVYGLTGSRTGSEDIAQDAFLKAHRAWHEVGRHPNPEGWVRVVAMNLARSRLRRLGAEARALARLVGSRTASLPELGPHNERFWAIVRSLPTRQREVVALHYLEDMPVAVVAAVLGIAESTVKNSLAQARRTLADTLEVSL
jgi:RNA polymerase sigma-70 factor (ECF subfamily)